MNRVLAILYVSFVFVKQNAFVWQAKSSNVVTAEFLTGRCLLFRDLAAEALDRMVGCMCIYRYLSAVSPLLYPWSLCERMACR